MGLVSLQLMRLVSLIFRLFPAKSNRSNRKRLRITSVQVLIGATLSGPELTAIQEGFVYKTLYRLKKDSIEFHLLNPPEESSFFLLSLIMKFFAALIALPCVALAATLSWDTTFDNNGTSLTTVACSDGMNGLITRGFTTFGSLKNFPNIGAVPAIMDWNSSSCGTCWNVTYTNGQGGQKSINVLGIDIGHGNFNVAKAAMNNLTNNQADQLGRVHIDAVRIAASNCGL